MIETFRGAGGRPLRFRSVGPGNARHQLLYLHGIESHGAWFLDAAHRLGERSCRLCLMDRRGSGLNRDLDPGDAESAAILLQDVRLLREHLGVPDLHLVGLSWGGKLALAAALDAQAGVKSVILVTPGLCSRLDLGLWTKLALLVDLLSGGKRKFHVPIEPEMFTTNPRFLQFIRQDPGRLDRVTGRFLMASRFLDRMIRERIGEVTVPLLLFLAGRDQIIDNDGVLRLLSALPRGQVRVRRFEEATHSIQFDHVEAMVEDITAFLDEQDHHVHAD